MCATILRIEVAGPERRARRIFFDDEHEPRQVSTAILKELALGVGVVVDPDQLEAAVGEIELQFAKSRALQLLGYRERSRAELTAKLLATGYPRDVVDTVVARFVEVELVDDRRYAWAFARSRSAAGYGSRRIARELQSKGISESLVAEVLHDVAPAQDDFARATSALRGRTPADASEGRRLVRRLVGRGFDLSVAIRAVEAAGGDSEVDDL